MEKRDRNRAVLILCRRRLAWRPRMREPLRLCRRFFLLCRESQKDDELQRKSHFDNQRHMALHPHQENQKYDRKPLPPGHAQPLQPVFEPQHLPRSCGDRAAIPGTRPKTGNREEA
jgi:hypothetical protein